MDGKDHHSPASSKGHQQQQPSPGSYNVTDHCFCKVFSPRNSPQAHAETCSRVVTVVYPWHVNCSSSSSSSTLDLRHHAGLPAQGRCVAQQLLSWCGLWDLLVAGDGHTGSRCWIGSGILTLRLLLNTVQQQGSYLANNTPQKLNKYTLHSPLPYKDALYVKPGF